MRQTLKTKVDCKIKLDVLHGFGSLCSQGLKDSVSIIDDDIRKILFPIGRYFALKQLDKSEEQFIKLPENTAKLICMAVSPNRKCLAASVQIKGDNFPQILIYNIKNYLQKGERERIFRYTESKSEHFTQLAFSGGDARFLVCMTGPPAYQILFLDIARMKQLGMATLGHPINKLSINPKENHVISMSGQNTFKILRVQENQFKHLNEIGQLPLNQNFTDHAWLDETYLIAGTDKGTVYIIQNYEVQEIFENSFNEKNVYLQTISAFSKGFIIGSDKGHLALYMKIDEYDDGVEDYKFMLKRTFMADRRSSICHINISTKQDIVAVSFKSNDIATFELSPIISPVNDLLSTTKDVLFDYLFNGFHSNAITSMDVCLQRPLIVTCSKYDSSIRVWNYMNFKCELARKFYVGEKNTQQDLNYQSLQCVAFHPFGYYIAAGFVDKIRFFHLLHDQLRTYKEIVLKNCSLLKYSNGGQYLAAAFSKNKSNICYVNIYNSYSAELAVTLKGHSNQITDIQWDTNDHNIYTIGNDGNIFMYTTNNNWNRKDFQQQNSKYQCLVFSDRGGLVVCGQEQQKNIVREISEQEFTQNQDITPAHVQKDKNSLQQQQQKEEVDQFNQILLQNTENEKAKVKQHPLAMINLTSMTFLNSLKNYQAIIGGCDQGFIRVYSAIFNQKAFEVMASHDGEVTKVRTSPDGRYVFSTGQDGAVFIYQVSEITSEGNLVALQNISETNNPIDDNSLNPRAMIVDENLADVVLVSRMEIDKYLNKQKQLRNEIEDLENKIEQKHLKEKLLLIKEKKDIQEKLNKQIEDINFNFEELKIQKQEMEKDYNNLLKNIENNHLKAVEELENLYEKKLAFENEKYIQLECKQTEEKLRQKQQLEDVKAENRKTLEIVKNKFQDKFGEVEGLFKVTKENAIDVGQMFQEKLAQQEEEYELEIEIQKAKYKKEKDGLQMENMNLKSKYDQLILENKEMREELDLKEKNNNNLQNQIEKLNFTIQEQDDRIKMTQKELKEQEESLKKKEKKLYEYKYKISDLQKAKHVLSFRTAEMRKSLEPKEAQIEKLKEELFKLEGEFENILKTSQKQNDKIKKLMIQVETVEKNYEDQKQITKIKENLINKIAMDIYNCVNSKDIKEWPTQMKLLYQEYVSDENIKQIKEDPKGVEERQRQIQHLENCIDQIHVSSNNIIKRREVDIRKKTMENAILIYDLNQIRKKNKEYDGELTNKITLIEYKDNEIRKLKAENKKLLKLLNSDKGQYQQQSNMQASDNDINLPILSQNQNNYGVQSSTNLQQKYNSFSTNLNIGGQQTIETEKKIQNLLNKHQNNKINKKLQGKIYKGSNFDAKTLGAYDKAKIIDLMIDLENSTNRLVSQDNMIKNLKQKIKNHILQKGCEDMSFEGLDDNYDIFQQFEKI